MQEYKANGKLLLTAEYVVLDGAKALCLPCRLGQKLEVSKLEETSNFLWEAELSDSSLWFSVEYEIDSNNILLKNTTKEEPALFLMKILKELLLLKPNLNLKGLKFKTKLDFPKNWGLGSSSTLIALLSDWAKVNPYELLEKTFGGSGYDLACAVNNQPIYYERNRINPKIEKVDFYPSFHEHLFFVYLNQKQNSREGIKMYRNLEKDEILINKISEISEDLVNVNSLENFNQLLDLHEELLSNHLGIPTVKEKLFSDYTGGSIKSLGAWGGDFIMVSSLNKNLDYFKAKGYNTIIKYKDLIL
ncbi:GHMP kinase [Weeksellaceae bacterium TAE3-ERU29]|nr:GHMP kinase [Weeksellaceae bacterium TAE3-ERU29]